MRHMLTIDRLRNAIDGRVVMFQVARSVDRCGVQGTALHHGQCPHDTSDRTSPVGHRTGALLEQVSLALCLSELPQH